MKIFIYFILYFTCKQTIWNKYLQKQFVFNNMQINKWKISIVCLINTTLLVRILWQYRELVYSEMYIVLNLSSLFVVNLQRVLPDVQKQ